jgi:hypothetical protein
MRRLSLFLSLVLVSAACGGGGSEDPDARPTDGSSIDAGPDANPDMPQTLAETGLCLDDGCEQISPDVHEFTPEYILWSDGATKRRWIYLPPGTQIDTTDMDFWQFPEGTKVWKEFTRDGVRVETRLLQKTGPDPQDWYYASFVWNATQDATTFFDVIDGNENANGTPHDVPNKTKCRNCHDRTPGRVIGFSAILLDHPSGDAQPGLTLADVIGLGWLTTNPTGSGSGIGEYFPLPGTATDQAALGYLHTNCGNCHNPQSDVQNQVSVTWRLGVGDLATVTGTPAYVTAVGVANQLPLQGANAIIDPHSPTTSAAYLRMSSTDPNVMMPKVGHEDVDTVGVAAIAAWINSI